MYKTIQFCLLFIVSMMPLITIIFFAFLAIRKCALIGYILLLYLIFPSIIAIIVLPPLMVIAAHCND